MKNSYLQENYTNIEKMIKLNKSPFIITIIADLDNG